jgi:hypothetical protein
MDNAAIYSKIEYPDAVSAKKIILSTQINLINISKKIDSYRNLRKSEMILKLKLRNNLKNIKEGFIKINDHVPQTRGIKHIKLEPKKREKEVKRNISIQQELTEIQRRLNELQHSS